MNTNIQTRLPKREVEAIDELVKDEQFTSRSDFVRKAVSFYLMQQKKGVVI